MALTNEIALEALSAVGAVVAAVIAYFALQIARRGIKLAEDTLAEAERARKVTLSITLSERFSSDDMHKALAFLGQRRKQYNNDIAAMCDAYVAEEAAKSEEVSEWGLRRRVVSKFFIVAYAQCKEGLLEPNVFAEQIQRGSIELYVQVVAPLDEAHATRVQKNSQYFDHRVREYFTSFLRDHFGHA